MQKRVLFGAAVVLLMLFAQGDVWNTKAQNLSIAHQTTTTTAAAPVSEDSQIASVARVIDGDTIVVDIGSSSEKVRLIGVNTPETVDPRRPVECFGKEASTFAKSLLTGKQVRLEPDSTQDNRDKYGRLLRYVFLDDGSLVNKTLIAEGYGHEYTYHIPCLRQDCRGSQAYRYQAEFKQAERTARENKKGLWASGTCGALS